MDPLRQFTDPEKVPCPHACCRSCEGVPDDINLLCAGLHLHPAVFVFRQELPDLADLPCRFDFNVQSLLAECHDFLHGFLQIRAGCSHQEQVINVPKIMPDVMNAFPAPVLEEAAGNEVVQRRQIDVCKPRAGEVSNCQIPRILEQRFLDGCRED